MRQLLGLIKKKKENKIEKSNAELLHFNWFFDKVKFRRQSRLAMALGILAMLSSFSIFFMGGIYGGSGLDIFSKFITWILIMLSGIALVSLGARKVPDYPSLANAIEDFVKNEIKQSKNNDETIELHNKNS